MEKYIRYQLVQSPEDFEKCKDIILEYLKILGIDLTYMNLPEEFVTMDKKYSGNEGVLILALDGDEAIGCVGVRKIEPGIAELKRLYVRDSHRGLKIGITLLEKALANAGSLGYNKIRLDVIPTLPKAKELYRSFGFYEIPPYFDNPVEGTAYMEKVLNEEQ
jgi:putative acetyltransferase